MSTWLTIYLSFFLHSRFTSCLTFSFVLLLPFLNFLAALFTSIYYLVSFTISVFIKLRVFENMALRGIFGRRRDEVTWEWRRLHNEQLNDLYCSPNIVRVIKSGRMIWAGNVARVGEERGCIGSWWGNRRVEDHWGDLGVDGWIILGRISRRWDVGIWTGLGWHRIETGGGRL